METVVLPCAKEIIVAPGAMGPFVLKSV
jgi:hypothetical protein